MTYPTLLKMMFADDTKMFGNPGSFLQLDINRADEWAQNWKMKFNVDKCKVLHFNQCENNNYDYYMEEQNTICKMTSMQNDINAKCQLKLTTLEERRKSDLLETLGLERIPEDTSKCSPLCMSAVVLPSCTDKTLCN